MERIRAKRKFRYDAQARGEGFEARFVPHKPRRYKKPFVYQRRPKRTKRGDLILVEDSLPASSEFTHLLERTLARKRTASGKPFASILSAYLISLPNPTRKDRVRR